MRACVQRQRLHRLDELFLQLLVAALLARRQRAGGRQPVLDLLVLQLAQLLVGVGDDVEGLHDLRAKLGFHRGQRQARLVLVVLFLFQAAHVGADIGDVVVVAAGRRMRPFSSARASASSSGRATTGACLASGPA